MNRILISLLVAFSLLVNCNLCLAQGAEADSNDAGTVSGDAAGNGTTAGADKAAEPADANRQRHQRNLERIRQRRKQMLESRERTGGRLRPRAGRGGSGGPEKRLEQLRLQLERENEKHLRRVARINRIKELAAEEGSTKVVERVDKLLNKEQQRHSRKQKRLQSEVRNLARSGFRRRQTERLKKGEPAVRGTGKRYLQRQKSRDAATNKKKQ